VNTGAPEQPGTTPATPKKEPKVFKVWLYGHNWPVYPMDCRGRDIFRVKYKVDGKVVKKTFPSRKLAKEYAKSLLRERHGTAESKIHLTDDEKRDWQAAVNVKKQAGIRASLETVVRHYADLAKIVGDEALLTDVARKYAEGRGKGGTPITVAVLRDDYLAHLKKKERSERYIEAQRSHTGQFTKKAGDVMSDRVTRELLQDFIDKKKDEDGKNVDARTKKNLLDAVKAMMTFGKSQRRVPADWDEADHVVLPSEKPKLVRMYTAEELKKLLAGAPKKFKPVLALGAFAGLRSSEIELLEWKHVRVLEKNEKDQIIMLDVDVTDEASKRTVQICKTLRNWLPVGFKFQGGKIWNGSHDAFYRAQQVAAKSAGVEWKNNALRHTCISARVALTGDVPRVAYESGNSVQIIKTNYLGLLTPSEAAAWFAVDRVLVGKYEWQLERRKHSNR
jgi:integrase